LRACNPFSRAAGECFSFKNRKLHTDIDGATLVGQGPIAIEKRENASNMCISLADCSMRDNGCITVPYGEAFWSGDGTIAGTASGAFAHQ
jgi:hypothetical protein